jgi:hypothetical protein
MIARVAFWIAAVALTSCQKPSALPISGHSSEVAKEATEQSPLFLKKQLVSEDVLCLFSREMETNTFR